MKTNNLFDLKGKVAIVTGGGNGIGKACCLMLSKAGAAIAVSDLKYDDANKVADEIRNNGGKAIAIECNVTKDQDLVAVVETTVKELGGIHILVNNAGIMDNFVPAGEVTDELWEKVFAVNVTGPMRAIRKGLPILLKKGSGVIINIASAGGLLGSRAGASYTASKHAVVGLTKNVGFQYAKLGIRCNAIAPGAVNTNIGTTIYDPSKFGMERAMAGINLNPRVGEPEEIAKVALFLASDDSSFINGAIITADAGWTAY